MSIQGVIICIFLIFLISFIYLRGFLYGIKIYQLNNSAYKKRKKNETLKEWFLYSRYKEEIPRILRFLYYAVLLIHFAGMVFCICVYASKLSLDIARIVAKCIYYFDGAWMLTIAFLFWSPGPGYAYERWITKKRGQKRGKKQ